MQELLAKLNTLITEIHNNTAAVNNLSASMLLESEAEEDSEDSEALKTYLDGTPFAG